MRFCDPNCRRKAKVIRQAKKAGTEIPVFLDEQVWDCVECGSPYQPSDSNQKYRTIDCRDQAYTDEKYKDVPSHLSTEVTCLECGETFTGYIPHGGRSGKHLEDKHGMTTEEYQAKYPNALIYSEVARWKMIQKERVFPEDFSDRCRDAQLKRYEKESIWNLGFTSETHPSVAKISETKKADAQKPDYVNSFRGKKHTDETKALIAAKFHDRKTDFVSKRNWVESKERSARTGRFMSEPHAVLIQAMMDAGLWNKYSFDYEKWFTYGDLVHGVDICTKTPLKLAIEVDGCRYHGCREHGNYHKLDKKYQDEVDQQMLKDAEIDKVFSENGWVVLRL